MLLEDGDKCLEELVVTETLRTLFDAVGIEHGQVGKYGVKLLHLAFTVLHGVENVLNINRSILQQLLHVAQVYL